jgi:glycosyltransferase involved in cell wall biosynthesis
MYVLVSWEANAMNVLHLTHRYYPFVGGSELYCQEMSERLARDGHQVTVYTTDARDLEYLWDPAAARMEVASERHNGVDIRRFPVRHIISNKSAYGFMRSAMRKLSRLPVNTRPLLFPLCRWTPWIPELDAQLARNDGDRDIVHVTNILFDSIVYASFRSAKRRKIPFVITPFVHLGEPDDSSTRRDYTMPHQVAMMKESDAVIVQTDLERGYLSSCGVPAEKMKKIGVGIDPPRLLGGQGQRFRERRGVEGPIVFYMGAQAYEKGTVHLVEAMSRLWERDCNAQLVLAGPVMSEFARYFESMPEGVRKRCHLLGFVSDEEKRDLLDAGDIFVMPSRTDSFGIVYLEAWLYKKPVIGALAGGVPEVISDGDDGLLVPFGDVPHLAAAIDRLLAEGDLARRLGERGHRKAVGEHTWDRKYAMVKSVYEGLTG